MAVPQEVGNVARTKDTQPHNQLLDKVSVINGRLVIPSEKDITDLTLFFASQQQVSDIWDAWMNG
ncbi:MAG: hypothetical protein AB8H47_18780 [Bacteroidia bacterium]